MANDGRIRRSLPLGATTLLLGIAVWRISRAHVPPAAALAMGALVLAALAAGATMLRLRLLDRAGAGGVVLVHGAVSVGLATGILILAGPTVPDRLTIAVIGFLAVVLSMNPAGPPAVLVAVGALALGGLAAVWFQTGLVSSGRGGITGLLVAEGLVASAAVLAWCNWDIGDRHSRAQTLRLRAVAEAARRISTAIDPEAVARAALSGCRDAYPQATWGGILVLDESGRRLVAMPVHLEPSGICPNTGADFAIGAGEGVSGSVLATGVPLLLRTRAEIARAYARTSRDRTAEMRRFGGAGAARSFIACPLRSTEGDVTGVLVLNSHLRERAWENDDLTVVQGIADAAAVAVERAVLHQQHERQALTDPLTGHGNRRAFESRLDRAGAQRAVLAIDVDNLKAMNDEYGHEAGDRLLVEVARTLAAQLRPRDFLARTGGDEFVAILEGVGEPEAALAAERMRRSLHGVALPHGVARVSIGVAAGDAWGDVRAAWSAADAALAAAKRGGRDRVERAGVAPGGEPRTADIGRLLTGLLSGKARLLTALQPIRRLADGVVAGHEALARFPSLPGGGPGVEEVFATAHRLGAMRDLDWLCRRTALSSAASLPVTTPLFINVSVTALLDPLHPADQMVMLCEITGRSPDSLVLEISEREAITDVARLRAVLASYREHGFRFALDDVGDGHSTLEVLAAAVPEYVKLAPRLTAAMSDRGSMAAIAAAVAFARGTGRSSVIAEGIEDEPSARMAAAAGVELGQGYWLGRPALPERAAPTASAAPGTAG